MLNLQVALLGNNEYLLQGWTSEKARLRLGLKLSTPSHAMNQVPEYLLLCFKESFKNSLTGRLDDKVRVSCFVIAPMQTRLW